MDMISMLDGATETDARGAASLAHTAAAYSCATTRSVTDSRTFAPQRSLCRLSRMHAPMRFGRRGRSIRHRRFIGEARQRGGWEGRIAAEVGAREGYTGLAHWSAGDLSCSSVCDDGTLQRCESQPCRTLGAATNASDGARRCMIAPHTCATASAFRLPQHARSPAAAARRSGAALTAMVCCAVIGENE